MRVLNSLRALAISRCGHGRNLNKIFIFNAGESGTKLPSTPFKDTVFF